ncbi:hypothetical protein NEMBOFW57_002446 [Staphylotrichum longicolle]|uniref:Secondary alcohol dehydrogenase n=1 Tax=Staphylotrichum longicolle TaxID=669026 RepID=A0AAD4I2H9_9PEZI|nr:hypothetical protein NEMBOFW57_002446 [Staphylotrichum longicolle]
MSADSLPITPTAFAAALQDLPLSALHLKVLELRNSIAHLDYSNEQLRPFAEGTATALSTTSPAASTQMDTQTTQQQTEGERGGGGGDPECADAIRENEQVIERMQERIRLVRAEVEGRGLSWTEFSSQDETATATIDTKLEEQGGEGLVLNGVSVNGATEATTTTATGGGETENGAAARQQHTAWSDGTFQTGVIRGGVVHMDGSGGGVSSSSTTTTTRQGGGSLTDEELRRRMEEQLRDLGGDEEDGDGLHL